MVVPKSLRRYLPVGAAITVFLLVVVFVNPLREGAYNDEWAYALSVRNLLQTGVNAPYPWWFPTFFPIHTYWGGLFSLILGYSLVSLRVSSVVLMLGGLVAFYTLAREYAIGEWPAALLSVVLFANPLVMLYTFIYMSDVPFMVWLIVALAAYTRGRRLHRYPWLIGGSAAAGAAILTRFIGCAFLPGLLLAWLLDKERKRTWRMWLAGAVLPALAGAWIADQMLLQPVQFTGLSLGQQTDYLNHLGDVLLVANWRLVAILEYLALFSLPLLFVLGLDAAIRLFRRRAAGDSPAAKPWWLWLGIACLAYVAATLIYSSNAMDTLTAMPLLQGDPSLYRRLSDLVPALSVVTTLGAGVLGALFILRYVGRESWRDMPAQERLIDLVTVFLLGGILVLFVIFDRYVLIVWPYALLLVGRALWKRWGAGRMWLAAIPLLALMLVVNALWTRWFMARIEAQWTAGEQLVASGVSPDEIFSNWEWNSYHGAYALYIQERQQPPVAYSNYLFRWLPRHFSNSDYYISPRIEDVDLSGWTVVTTVAYDHWGFPERPIYVFRRVH